MRFEFGDVAGGEGFRDVTVPASADEESAFHGNSVRAEIRRSAK
jgi:hypothetical protein